MSKDITIQQAGVAVALTGAELLKIPELLGGTSPWVPEDECTTGEISITANGVYTAADSQLYAFSKATVNVPQGSQAVGTGQDGKYYKVTVSEGEFVYTEVPKTMQITTPPTTTSYVPKATIDYTGLVCNMYKADGTIYTDTAYPDGTIPLSEILRPTQTVEAGMTRVEVFWVCPQSGLVLSDSFQITVTEE